MGLEASKNPIFKELTSKIGPNSNLATFTKKSKISSCRKNWLVTGMQVKFSGNYLIDSNKWWKFQSNWRTVIDSLRCDLGWNDPYTFQLWRFHPNKTVNEKKSRKCKKYGYHKFLILVLCPSKLQQYWLQKFKCRGWQWTNFQLEMA